MASSHYANELQIEAQRSARDSFIPGGDADDLVPITLPPIPRSGIGDGFVSDIAALRVSAPPCVSKATADGHFDTSGVEIQYHAGDTSIADTPTRGALEMLQILS